MFFTFPTRRTSSLLAAVLSVGGVLSITALGWRVGAVVGILAIAIRSCLRLGLRSSFWLSLWLGLTLIFSTVLAVVGVVSVAALGRRIGAFVVSVCDGKGLDCSYAP